MPLLCACQHWGRSAPSSLTVTFSDFSVRSAHRLLSQIVSLAKSRRNVFIQHIFSEHITRDVSSCSCDSRELVYGAMELFSACVRKFSFLNNPYEDDDAQGGPFDPGSRARFQEILPVQKILWTRGHPVTNPKWMNHPYQGAASIMRWQWTPSTNRFANCWSL